MLPSIDKTNRNPAPPKSEHVRKIDPSDRLHPRDYAYEIDRALEREHHKPGQDHEFGEDTFEPSEDAEQETPPKQNNSESKDPMDHSDHDSSINIII